MQIEGNVYKVGEVQSGTSQQGNQWRRQNVVVEYYENPTDMWTQKIVLQLGGNHIDEYHLKVGDKVRVRFGLYANEWQGKYYQEVKLAQDGLQVISRLGQQQTATPPATTPPTAQQPPVDMEKAQELKPAQEIAQPDKVEVKGDDLPF